MGRIKQPITRAKGRLSKSEWDYIEKNSNRMTADQMAKNMNRDIEPVRLYLQKIGKTNNKKAAFEVQAEYDIKTRLCWKELKTQFSEQELEMFLYHWKQIIAQFRRDVLATEELQIIDTIKLEILMNRALREQQETITSIRLFEEMVQDLESVPVADRDKEQYFSLQRQVASLRSAKEALSRDYKELQTKKSAMFKDLKATREQRVQKLESNKVTFAGLVTKLLQDPDFYEEQGRQMELARMATQAVKEEFGSYHRFADGEIDRILLSSDSVMGDTDNEA
jgi:hypothetical protein